MDEQKKREIEEHESNLDKHKAAIAKLSDRLQRTQTQLSQQQSSKPSAGGAASPEEVQKLQNKLDQL